VLRLASAFHRRIDRFAHGRRLLRRWHSVPVARRRGRYLLKLRSRTGRRTGPGGYQTI